MRPILLGRVGILARRLQCIKRDIAHLIEAVLVSRVKSWRPTALVLADERAQEGDGRRDDGEGALGAAPERYGDGFLCLPLVADWGKGGGDRTARDGTYWLRH